MLKAAGSLKGRRKGTNWIRKKRGVGTHLT
jgi:hypothetical protein